MSEIRTFRRRLHKVVAIAGFRDQLRARRFTEDTRDDPPVICRWRHGIYRIDVMPVDGAFMGFRGAWFRSVRDRPWSVDIRGGITLHVARAPELLATKAEAFGDRGHYVASKDIEDFLSIVNGRR